jgi:4-amino-4-deoxy-L-arabinose transferase-like glycosyltransferase
MGLDIAWLLPAAIICLVAGLILTRRASRTDSIRAALISWGGWLVVSGVVFSYAGGIIHAYYTVALAPAVGACIGIGSTLLWQRRFDVRASTAMAGTVVVTTVLAAVLLARHAEWLPWLRAIVSVAGVGAAVLLLASGWLTTAVARSAAAVAIAVCLAGPAAYSVTTAAASHTGAIPGVGPAHHAFGGDGGPVGLLEAPKPRSGLSETLARDADRYTWAAAVIGSNNAAGYQLSSGVPVMAIGGFNGTDPAPTLEQFQDYVDTGRIHYFIRDRMMTSHWGSSHGGSREAVDIATWVEAHFTPHTIDQVVIYDLDQPNS